MMLVLFILSFLIPQVLPQCAPDPSFVDFPSKFIRGETTFVNPYVSKCNGSNDLYYLWELKDSQTEEIISTSTDPVLAVDGYEISDQDLVFRRAYLINLTVSHYPNMSLSNSYADIFTFDPNEMVLEISGGSSRSHSAGRDLVLDGRSLSRDLSYSPGTENFTDGYDVTWTIEPSIPGFVPGKSMQLTVPKSFLHENETFNFTMTVVRTKFPQKPDTKAAWQVIFLTHPTDPEINIQCLRNCNNSHPWEKTTLIVKCTKQCHNLNYTWALDPPVSADKIDFGNGSSKIVIQPDTYNVSDKVEVVARVDAVFATYTLNFIDKLREGTCEIHPDDGVSGVTMFTVSCAGFHSRNEPLRYTISEISSSTGQPVALVGGSYSSSNKLLLSAGDPTELVVLVQDSVFSEVEYSLNATVQPFSPPTNTPKDSYLKHIVMGNHPESLPKLTSGDRIIQTVSYVLDATLDMNSSKSEIMDFHKYLSQNLKGVEIKDFATAGQLMSILDKLVDLKFNDDILTSRNIGTEIHRIARRLHNYILHSPKDPKLPLQFTVNFTETVCHVIGQLLSNITELDSTLKAILPSHDYETYDEMDSNKLIIRDSLRDLVQKSTIALQILGNTLLHKNVANEKATSIPTALLNFTVRRVGIPENPTTMTISSATGDKVVLPKALLEELREKYKRIDYHYAKLNENPFWWHTNVSHFGTDLTLFSLFSDCKKISSFKNPFYVHMKTKIPNVGKVQGDIEPGKLTAYRLNVDSGSIFIANFKESTGDFLAMLSDCYCKDSTFNDDAKHISTNSNSSDRTLKIRVGCLNQLYICVKSLGGEVHYEGEYGSFSCNHWNLKTGSWDTSHCIIQEASMDPNGTIVCECRHASFFAGQIIVPPNAININLDFNFQIELVTNWFAPAFVFTMLLISALIFLCAWCADERHRKRNFICRLEDNIPGDPHPYLFVVTTGFYLDARTTADVAFQVIGKKAKSRIHLIKCLGGHLLNRNGQDWLIFFTPCYLGDLVKIRLWHNCRGTRPHWYCSRIIVQYLKSGKQYYFMVEKWFSLAWADRKIYYEIPVETIDVSYPKKKLFNVVLETQFKDTYIWLSVFTRDPQSNFSSLERVGAALLALFLSMLANAMFHGIPTKSPMDSIDNHSHYYINSNDIAIFIESWLVVTPITIIVLQIFRNSAPRIITRHRKKVIPKTYMY